MRTIILTVIILLLTINTIGQSNFIDAEVILIDGTKLKGLINDKGWYKSPKFIEFKESNESETQKYKPSEVKSFKISESYFLSVDREIVKTYMKVNKSIIIPSPEYIKRHIFYKVLIEGRISLYHYRDENSRDHFFIKKGNAEVIELIYYQYFTTNEYGKEILMNNKKYTVQLKYLFKDCSEMKNKSTNVSYTLKNISKLIMSYNNCFNDEVIEYVNPEKKLKKNFYIKAGISYSTIDFKGNTGSLNSINLATSNFSYSINPMLSISGDFILPYWNNRFAITTDLHYRMYKVDGTSHFNGFMDYWDYENEIEASYLGTIIGIKYNTNLNKINPFMAIGLANSFALSNDSKTISVQTLGSTVNTNEFTTFENFRKYSQGFAIDIGVDISNIIIQLRYYQDNGMSSLDNLSSKNKAYSLLLGYKF